MDVVKGVSDDENNDPTTPKTPRFSLNLPKYRHPATPAQVQLQARRSHPTPSGIPSFDELMKRVAEDGPSTIVTTAFTRKFPKPDA